MQGALSFAGAGFQKERTVGEHSCSVERNDDVANRDLVGGTCQLDPAALPS